MKIFTFIIFVPIVAFSKVNVELIFKDSQVVQGAITNAEIRLMGEPEEIKKILLEKKTFAETFYIYQRKDNLVKVIFYNEPKAEVITDKQEDVEIDFNLKNFSFKSIQPSDQMIFESFSLDQESKLLYFIFLALSILGVLYFPLKRWQAKKQLVKEKKLYLSNLREKILRAKSFDDIIFVCKEKEKFFFEFPQIKEQFLKFELILNKHQFKPEVSEVEKVEIMEAFRKFQRNIEVFLNGV